MMKNFDGSFSPREVRSGDRLVFPQELLEIIRNLHQGGQGLVLRSGMEDTLAMDIN